MAASRVIVYGGKGALGTVIVDHFKSQNWWVCSIDMRQNEAADENITVDVTADLLQQQEHVTKQIQTILNASKVDAVLCVAGGWAGGNAASEEFIKNYDMMTKQSAWTSVIAAHIAALHLKEGGALVLTGAQPAISGTPGMIGYGMAKASVHQLVKSLAAPDSGLPANAFVGAILPVTMDTPMNRKFMPDADHSKWTPLPYVAELLRKWSVDSERPKNGSLIQLFTKENETSLVNVEL